MIGFASLLLACPLVAGQVEPAESTREALAFVEVSADPESCYVQQPIRVSVRFGVEEEFSRTRAIQPFHRRLDVPVQLVVPWIEDLPGARALGLVESAPGRAEPDGPSFALNEGVRRARRVADRQIEDRRFRVYEIEARYLPTSVGELSIPAPALLLAHASRFEESLLDERVPVDRQETRVWGQPIAVPVRALPEEGRPWAFTGAVGKLTVRAEVHSPEVQLGESLMLELIIEGEGNLLWFEAPDWREIGEFHVRGILDEATPNARTLTFDLAPASEEVRQVPSISFVYFDPGPPSAYRAAVTDPIDVTVYAAPADGVEEPPARGILEAWPPREIQVNPDEKVEESSWTLPFFSTTGLAVLFLFIVLAMRRRS